MVSCVGSYPEQEINQASTDLLNQHANYGAGGRILAQEAQNILRI